MAQMTRAKNMTVSTVMSKKAGGEDAPPLKKMHVQFEDDDSDDEYQTMAKQPADGADDTAAAEPDKAALAFDEKTDENITKHLTKC